MDDLKDLGKSLALDTIKNAKESLNKSPSELDAIDAAKKLNETKNSEEKLEEKVEELSHDDQLEKLSQKMHLLFSLFKVEAPKLAKRKKNSLVRVLEALLFSEFNDVNLSGKEEKKLLDICMEVVETKGVMYNMMVRKQLEEEENNNG